MTEPTQPPAPPDDAPAFTIEATDMAFAMVVGTQGHVQLYGTTPAMLIAQTLRLVADGLEQGQADVRIPGGGRL